MSPQIQPWLASEQGRSPFSHCRKCRTLLDDVSTFPEIVPSMTHAVPNIRLSICLTEAQLCYLAYLYPEVDPEEALVKLLECDRLPSLRRAERQIKVLHLDGESGCDRLAPAPPEQAATPLVESENPIGALQEYCQGKMLNLPTYDFEDVAEGFCCTVRALGLTASDTASTKKGAKTEAAALLLGALARAWVYFV
ncbi:MAG: hypothetical protein WCA35_25485 [Kovacikia sp.]